MPKEQENLYQDKFFNFAVLINSALVHLLVGAILSLVAYIYIHWIVSTILIVVTIVLSLASYIVLRK